MICNPVRPPTSSKIATPRQQVPPHAPRRRPGVRGPARKAPKAADTSPPPPPEFAYCLGVWAIGPVGGRRRPAFPSPLSLLHCSSLLISPTLSLPAYLASLHRGVGNWHHSFQPFSLPALMPFSVYPLDDPSPWRREEAGGHPGPAVRRLRLHDPPHGLQPPRRPGQRSAPPPRGVVQGRGLGCFVPPFLILTPGLFSRGLIHPRPHLQARGSPFPVVSQP